MDDLILEQISDLHVKRANGAAKVASTTIGIFFGRVEKLAQVILHGVLVVGLPVAEYFNKMKMLLDLQLVNSGQNFEASRTIGDGQLR
jgi:hypothetical protein